MPRPNLNARLRKATNFEAASEILLAEVAEVIRTTLAAEHPRKNMIPEPVRASVHLFDEGDWRDIAAVEWTPHRSEEFTRSEIRRSSTLWKLIREYASPLAVLTLTRKVYVYRKDGVQTFEAQALEQVVAEATMLRGAATHAVAIPLLNAGATPVGMVAVELRSRSMLEEVGWSSCFSKLQRLVGEVALTLVEKQSAYRRTDFRNAEAKKAAPDPAREDQLDLAECFARLKDHVLIKGPTGIGKTYLAREIHARSARTGPFVVYAAQSFPDDMQSAYLLGWKKGAFTGATADKTGAVDEAANGTLFVDEVDKLSLQAQKALLLLADKNPRYTPLGSTETKSLLNVRLIFATNADLNTAIERRLFLHDLHFRINELPIAIAPLSERKAEIPNWCRVLLRQIHRERFDEVEDDDLPACSIDGDAIGLLASLAWPGNLRQLNVILKRGHALASFSTPRDVRVSRVDVANALAMDGGLPGAGSPSFDVLAKFEALAAAIVHQTKLELQTWSPVNETHDDDNPGLANFVRTHDVLFPMVWRAAEREIGDSKRKEVAKLIGKLRSLAGKNFAQERTAAFNKVTTLLARFDSAHQAND